MTGFKDAVTLRFGALDLVRGEWRRFNSSLDATDPDNTDDNTGFDVVAVNIQENGDRLPIKYVTPPGVQLEELFNNNTLIPQNEQSLALRVDGDGLEPGDSRAVFKNVSGLSFVESDPDSVPDSSEETKCNKERTYDL